MVLSLESFIVLYFKQLERVDIQRIFYSCVFVIEALCFFIVIVYQHTKLTLTAFTIGIYLSGTIMSGFYRNNLCVAPKYGRALIGMSNMVRNIASLLIISRAMQDGYNNYEVRLM